MTIAIYTLTSTLHKESVADASTEPFIQEIEKALGEGFIYPGNDWSDYGTHDADLIYVRTGGTEGLFKGLCINGNVRLLTSGQSNSLAASMEILSYLRQHGQKGEILHGPASEIAERIKEGFQADKDESLFVKPLAPTDLGGLRLGVIGKPSGWLISSGVDYAKAKEKFNVELIDIPMEELVSSKSFEGVDMKSFQGSEAVYDALSGLIEKYKLGGLTLRCFDLLDTIHNTGCLALARLNAEGVPASCEGDIPALISMVWLQKTKGCPGFQCNLSKIDGDELLFAHCTIPLSMTTSYSYTTHFESGIGTAIKAEVPLGPVEIFKISPDLDHCVSIPGEIIRNESKPNLCRTQVVVRAPRAASYFLSSPLANHHIISLFV